jgi:hypothetical protein
MKSTSKQASDFGRVLADVGRAGVRDSERVTRLFNPAAGAAFPLGESDAGDAQGMDSVLDCFVEDASPTPEEYDLPLSDDPQTIAQELGLDRAANEEDLNRARRRFMWRNHPDRRGEAQRGLADRRVAVANMLIDRARAKLAAARRNTP